MRLTLEDGAKLRQLCDATQKPMQQACTAPVQAPTLRRSAEAQVALAAYRNLRAALTSYEVMSERDWKRSPLSPGMVLPQLWRQIEAAKQRCLALEH